MVEKLKLLNVASDLSELAQPQADSPKLTAWLHGDTSDEPLSAANDMFGDAGEFADAAFNVGAPPDEHRHSSRRRKQRHIHLAPDCSAEPGPVAQGVRKSVLQNTFLGFSSNADFFLKRSALKVLKDREA